MYTFFAKYGFIGYQACALLSQHWLIDNACTIPNEDALRPGWKTELLSKEKQSENAELLKELGNIETKKYDIFAKALKWGRNRKIFGIALAYPIIDGIDTEKPFNIDGVKPGSFKGIAIIDPYWCRPEFSAEGIINPLSAEYFTPAYYVFNGRRIHRSHLLIWLNDEPADILKPTYQYGGIPLTQMIYERVYAAEKCANEAPEILLTKRSTIAKSDDIANALLNEAETAKKLTWMRKLLNNFGIWLTEYDVHQLDTTLTGLTEIIDNQYKLVASVAKVPEHKLMKTNPSGGIGNTGEFSTKDYRLEVKSLQENGYKPFIERVKDIILRSDLDSKAQTNVIFSEIDLSDESEKADLQEKKTRNLATLIDKGIISPDEGRQSVIKDENSGLAWLPEDSPQDLITSEQERDLKALMDKKNPNGGNNPSKAEDKAFNEEEVNRDELGRFAEKNTNKEIIFLSSKEEVNRNADKYIKNADIIDSLTGKEFEGNNLEEKRSNAEAWANKNLNSKVFKNKSFEREIKVLSIGKAINEAFNEDKVNFIKHLPKVLTDSQYIGSMKDSKGRTNVKAFHYLACKINIGGHPQGVIISVREDNNGNIYYNHILRKKEAEDTNLSASTAGVYLSSAKDSIDNKAEDVNNADIYYLGEFPSSQGKSQAGDEWDEEKHPRGKDGKFKNSAGVNPSQKDTRINKPVPAKKDVCITPVIAENEVPQFPSFSELKKYIFNELNILGDVEVKSSGTTLHFGKGQVKRGLKRGRNNLQNQFFSNLKGSVENAQYSHFEEADELHPNVAGQDVYYTALKIGTKIYAIEIKADVLKNHQGNIYSYAGHKVVFLEKSQDSDPGLKPADYPDSISISDFEEIFKYKRKAK